MSLPASFAKDGFVGPSQTRAKFRLHNGQYLKPIMIGTEGETDTGKTRWALTAPGYIQMLAVDRAFSGVFDSPGRVGINPNVGIKVYEPPLAGTAKIVDYQAYYAAIRTGFYSALENKDSPVVVMDGDSDFFEIHILAHFGKTTQIYPQTRYAAPYAEKRAQIAKAWDSGKIIISTNKVKDEYETIYKPDGTAEIDAVTREEKRKKSGRKERQGFKDQTYLWDIQLRHLYKPPRLNPITNKPEPQQWGIEILKCKHDRSMVGTELWGDQCSFRGLVDYVYPDIPPERWGF